MSFVGELIGALSQGLETPQEFLAKSARNRQEGAVQPLYDQFVQSHVDAHGREPFSTPELAGMSSSIGDFLNAQAKVTGALEAVGSEGAGRFSPTPNDIQAVLAPLENSMSNAMQGLLSSTVAQSGKNHGVLYTKDGGDMTEQEVEFLMSHLPLELQQGLMAKNENGKAINALFAKYPGMESYDFSQIDDGDKLWLGQALVQLGETTLGTILALEGQGNMTALEEMKTKFKTDINQCAAEKVRNVTEGTDYITSETGAATMDKMGEVKWENQDTLSSLGKVGCFLNLANKQPGRTFEQSLQLLNYGERPDDKLVKQLRQARGAHLFLNDLKNEAQEFMEERGLMHGNNTFAGARVGKTNYNFNAPGPEGAAAYWDFVNAIKDNKNARWSYLFSEGIGKPPKVVDTFFGGTVPMGSFIGKARNVQFLLDNLDAYSRSFGGAQASSITTFLSDLDESDMTLLADALKNV